MTNIDERPAAPFDSWVYQNPGRSIFTGTDEAAEQAVVDVRGRPLSGRLFEEALSGDKHALDNLQRALVQIKAW